MDRIAILMVGLPRAGKTTYLAALWDYLETGHGSLSLARLPESTKYLNQIRKSWLTLVEMDRTAPAPVPVHLDLTVAERELELDIPDVSGERFRDAWEKRTWGRSIDELARNSTGLLLFVFPPNETEKSISLDDLYHLAAAAEGPLVDEVAEPPAPVADLGGELPPKPEEPRWTPDQSSMQVKLVDLLQILGERRQVGQPSPSPLRVAIVISAWDLVTQVTMPTNWLAAEMPLLFQFLECNSDVIVFKAFGVSAQGGSYAVKEQVHALQSHIHASDRVVCVDDAGRLAITAPLTWVADFDA